MQRDHLEALLAWLPDGENVPDDEDDGGNDGIDDDDNDTDDDDDDIDDDDSDDGEDVKEEDGDGEMITMIIVNLANLVKIKCHRI